MSRLEQALNTIAKNSIYSIAVALFAWPLVFMACVHVELILTRVSPVDVQSNPPLIAPDQRVLDHLSLVTEDTEPKADAPEPVKYVRIELYRQQHKVVGTSDQCDGATVGWFSYPFKSFKLSHRMADHERPFATACFPSNLPSEVTYLAISGEGAKKSSKPSKQTGYIVVIPGSEKEAGFMIFVESAKNEAHVRWARLSKSSYKEELNLLKTVL